MKVRSGLDIIANNDFKILRGARVALLANQSTVDSNLVHSQQLLSKSKNCKLVKIFGPEHGFFGSRQDMESVKYEKNQIPIVSLYGTTEESLSPKKEDFKNVDILLIDLPDIGTRYYTFAQTAIYCLKVAAATNTKVIILDRPNPLNGIDIEGSDLEDSCKSFCGYAPIPQRHGLTLAEHCLLANRGFQIGNLEILPINAEIEVVKCKNWQRTQYADQTGMPWVIPSPNMPTIDTAIVYPGGCLLEATNISEARGTTRPFELFGLPNLNTSSFLKSFNKLDLDLEGAIFRECSFIPQFQKHAKDICFGFQLHISSRSKFKSFRWYLAIIAAIKKSHPELFKWRTNNYEFRDNFYAIDLLYGSSKFRECLESKSNLKLLFKDISKFEVNYRKKVKNYLLYK
ncbi:MAG: DUF1343 domain-containing protein [Proteobacteria bacterium]|nr:DUF1343 domain-containing protein [Pseudomonadota bacterium]